MVRRAKVATISDATKAQIRAAHEAGRASEKYNTSESRYITVEGNSRLTLILPDGRTTLYGAYYYRELLNTEPIELYAMETPLINDKWVMGYSGKKFWCAVAEQTDSGIPQRRASNTSNTPAKNM